MTNNGKHIALVSLNEFDPYLRDGASKSILGRLQFLREKRNRVSILNFLSSDARHKHLGATLANAHGAELVRGGNRYRTVLGELQYIEIVLPYTLRQVYSDYHQMVLKGILKEMQELAPDYVFTTDQGYLPLFACWYLQIPGAHWFNSHENVRGIARNPTYAGFLQKRTIFANCRFLQEQIKGLSGLSSVLWHDLIDFDAYRLNAPPNSCGAIGYHTKGQRGADDLVREIIGRLPEYTFMIVGSDRYGYWTSARPSNADYRGYVSDMKQFYRRIALLLVPSVMDATPRVILEAAVNGIPTVAHDVGGIREVLGNSGVLIGQDAARQSNLGETARRYTHEIRRILKDETLYRRHSRKALLRAEEYEQAQNQWAQEIYEKYIR